MESMQSLYIVAFGLLGLPVAQGVTRVRARYPEILRNDDIFPGSTVAGLLRRGRRRGEGGDGWRAEHGIFVAIWFSAGCLAVDWLQASLVATFASTVIAAALVDWDIEVLPDELTGILVFGGLVVAALAVSPWALGPADAVGGVLVGYGALWLVAAGYGLQRGSVGMGHGDLKLVAGVGAWLGIGPMACVLVIAVLVQAGRLVVRRSIGPASFGPAIGVGTVVVTFVTLGMSALARYPALA